jgi:hypothetical protein
MTRLTRGKERKGKEVELNHKQGPTITHPNKIPVATRQKLSIMAMLRLDIRWE